MINLMQDGATWLGEQLQAAAGRSVTYRRGNRSATLTAVPSQHEYDVLDEDGFATKRQSYDFVVTAADLVLGSDTIEPRPGDRIDDTINGEERHFELMPLGDRPCCEWHDVTGIQLIVHCKRIK